MGRQELFWNTDDHIKHKYDLYKKFEQYLKIVPKTLCDIGCGFAHVPGWFNTKHNTEIWLLDKDSEYNTHEHNRHNDFGPVSDFEAYNTFESIEKSLRLQNVLKYKLLEPDDKTWNDAPKFDVIMSIFSLGFHYPVEVYQNFIRKHSHNTTKVFCSSRSITHLKGAEIKNVVHMHRDGKSGFLEIKI